MQVRLGHHVFQSATPLRACSREIGCVRVACAHVCTNRIREFLQRRGTIMFAKDIPRHGELQFGITNENSSTRDFVDAPFEFKKNKCPDSSGSPLSRARKPVLAFGCQKFTSSGCCPARNRYHPRSVGARKSFMVGVNWPVSGSVDDGVKADFASGFGFEGGSPEWPLVKPPIIARAAFPVIAAVGDFHEAMSRLVEQRIGFGAVFDRPWLRAIWPATHQIACPVEQ